MCKQERCCKDENNDEDQNKYKRKCHREISFLVLNDTHQKCKCETLHN